MRADFLLKRCVYHSAIIARCCDRREHRQRSTEAQGLPAYMAADRRVARRPARPRSATKNVLALNTGMFELYGDAPPRSFRGTSSASIRSSSACSRARAGGSSSIGPAWRRSRRRRCPIVYQLLKSVGHSTMAVSQVVGPYLDNPDRPVLAWPDAGLSQPDAVRARRPRRDADAAGVARQQSHHAAEQHRVHGRVSGEGRDRFSDAGSVRQEAGALSREERRRGRRRPRSPTG